MKSFLIVVALFGNLALAGEANLIDCVNSEGLSVQYASQTKEWLRVMATTKLALSTMGGDGVPLIILDVESLQATPVQFQNFVVLHECAHHMRGDVLNEKKIDEITLRKSDKERELKADCEAMKRLAQSPYNYNKEDIQVVMDTMKNELEKSSVQRDAEGRVVKKGIFKFYMPIEERNKALLACFNEAKERRQ